MATADVDDLADLAERRHRDPRVVLERVAPRLSDADARTSATAHWISGLALHELGQAAAAIVHYEQAIELSAAGGFPEREALARAGAAVSLVSLGDGAAAAAEVAAARAVAPASVAPVVDMLHGLVLQRTGQLAEALVVYRRALRALERIDDRPAIARLRLNRGILHAYRGNLDHALDDLHAAEQMALEHDLAVLAAMAAHNIGFARGRQGRLPEALAAFDRAASAYAAFDGAERLVGVLEADRCEVLLLAGLVPEAVAAADAAVRALDRLGDTAHRSECELLLARALLAAGRYDDAAARATAAASELGRAGRLPWAALAHYVVAQAETLASQDRAVPAARLLVRARTIADELEERGWPVEGAHVRTFVGRLALALGQPEVARIELADAASARARGTADLRAEAWHATALLRLAEGDRTGAKRALGRGFAVVDRHRGTLGATELRARAAGHSVELARLGIRLALADGAPAEVLRWVERSRAAGLRRPPVRPPDDAELASELAELRRARAEQRAAALEGGVDTAARRRVLDLEHRIRERTMRSGDDHDAAAGVLDVPRLRAALGDRTLVEYVSFEGRLHAVTVTRRRVRLHDLGVTATVADEKDYVLFALRRHLAGRGATEDALDASAARLDERLLAPLGLGDEALVVVPSAELQGLPWMCLPSAQGRSTTVAPSAAVWLGDGAASERRRGADVALVAGPELTGAASEVRALRRLHHGARVLTGRRADVAGALAAFEEASLVHVAAHGAFRADNPMFSSLQLSDGPLTVYDLERLRAAPETVVLSVCDGAVSAVHVGDELLGTASALLGLGVRSVVAPVVPVPDDATVGAMVGLHRRLAAGDTPAAALAAVAAPAFVCIGRDDALSE